jgi:hypothetical protein
VAAVLAGSINGACVPLILLSHGDLELLHIAVAHSAHDILVLLCQVVLLKQL